MAIKWSRNHCFQIDGCQITNYNRQNQYERVTYIKKNNIECVKHKKQKFYIVKIHIHVKYVLFAKKYIYIDRKSALHFWC